MLTPLVPSGSVSMSHIKASFPGVTNPTSILSYRGLLPTLPTTSQNISLLNFRNKTAPSPVTTFNNVSLSDTFVELDGTGSHIDVNMTLELGAPATTLNLKPFVQDLSYQRGVTYSIQPASVSLDVSSDAVLSMMPGVSGAVEGIENFTVSIQNGYGNTSSITIASISTLSGPQVYRIMDVQSGNFWNLDVDGNGDTSIRVTGTNNIMEVQIYRFDDMFGFNDTSRTYHVLVNNNDANFCVRHGNLKMSTSPWNAPYGGAGSIDFVWDLGNYKTSDVQIYNPYEEVFGNGGSYVEAENTTLKHLFVDAIKSQNRTFRFVPVRSGTEEPLNYNDPLPPPPPPPSDPEEPEQPIGAVSAPGATSFVWNVSNNNPSLANDPAFIVGSLQSMFPNATSIELHITGPAPQPPVGNTWIWLSNGQVFMQHIPPNPFPDLATFAPYGKYPTVNIFTKLVARNSVSVAEQFVTFRITYSNLHNFTTIP